MPAWRVAEVPFLGDTFTPRDQLNSRRLGKFAQLANKGDMPEMVAMAAINDLIDGVLRPEDMDRFDALCDLHNPDYEALAAFIADVLETMTARPTSRPSVSSDGPTITAAKSTDDSFSRAVEVTRGRPDLQLMVMMAQKARTA